MTAKQLTDSILQLAIQGKLVPQNPDDEPASVLLDRIREEKKRLVKEGKLKKKDLEEISVSEEEIPFEIPGSWEWVRLSQLCVRFSTGPFGTMVHKEDYVDSLGHPLVNPTNIKNGNVCSDGIKMVSDNKYEELSSYVLQRDDLILARRGDLSKIAIISELEEGWLAGTGAFFMHFIGGMFLPYFVRLYTTSYCQNYLLNQSVGGTMNNLNQKLLADFVVPMPPFDEQRRIVAKIEELLPLINEYGAANDELEQINAELPEKLKKSILQEAIMGKLGTQNPNDEPASVLLDRIREEKKQLVKTGVLKKKDLVETPVEENEIPFEIPESWEWVRLNWVSDIARGGSPRPIKEYITEAPEGVNWIKISDTEKGGKYIFKTKEKIKPEGVRHSRYVYADDFLLTNSMSFGRPYILKTEGCIHDGWLVISLKKDTFDQNFMYYLLSSAYAKSSFADKAAGAVVKNLNIDKVACSVFPLPPLAEQHRIVEKIEALFAEVDHIEI